MWRNCYSTHVLEMCEASVAICKTKSALYRHVVTYIHTHGICCIIEEWHYIWYCPEFYINGIYTLHK